MLPDIRNIIFYIYEYFINKIVCIIIMLGIAHEDIFIAFFV
jgi:hypothetical protein